MSSLALGATTTPPTTIPVPGRQNNFTKPSCTACIFARAFVASGSFTWETCISPASTWRCEIPTVAISGSVNTLAGHDRELQGLDGVTQCVLHGDSSLHGRNRCQHQYARTVARRVNSAGAGSGNPVNHNVAQIVKTDASVIKTHVQGVRYRAHRHKHMRAVHHASVVECHSDAVVTSLSSHSASTGQHSHTASLEHFLEYLGGVGVLTGQHAIPRRDQSDLRAQRLIGTGKLGAGDA
jgi:hypothetical protein